MGVCACLAVAEGVHPRDTEDARLHYAHGGQWDQRRRWVKAGTHWRCIARRNTPSERTTTRESASLHYFFAGTNAIFSFSCSMARISVQCQPQLDAAQFSTFPIQDVHLLILTSRKGGHDRERRKAAAIALLPACRAFLDLHSSASLAKYRKG